MKRSRTKNGEVRKERRRDAPAGCCRFDGWCSVWTVGPRALGVRRVLLLALMFVAAGAGWAQDRLVIVSPHSEFIQHEFDRAFKERHRADTGRSVDIKWLDLGGGTSHILRAVKAQFTASPNGIGMDLFFGGGLSPHIELKKLGFLQPYRVPPDILEKIAPDINGSPLYDAQDFMWYAPTMSGFGIIYNKVILDRMRLPTPKTWEDLARPEYFGWVGSADPRKSGSVHMPYEIILQAYGWERGWRIIMAIGANCRAFPTGAGQTPKDVALGEAAVGLAIDFYAWSQVVESGPDVIGYVLPSDLTMVDGDGMSILKGAPNRKTAERFVRFCMSEEGQKLWLLKRGEPGGPRDRELGRFSVMPDLYGKSQGRTSVAVNPFQWQSAFRYDPQLGSARWGIINDLIGTQIIDPHDRLTAAWRRALDEGGIEAAMMRFGTPPVTEADVRRLVEEGVWNEPGKRTRLLAEWEAGARARYGDSFLRSVPSLIALALGAAAYLYIRRRSRG